jgi:prepilin-type N-terminal cleavage/methylation domain-containing protein
MRTFIHLLHQKGMTLVEVMIAVALLGGVSLLTAKLMTDQANNQNFIKAKAEMAATVSRIESIMSDPVKCKAMLDKSTINANGVSASSLVALGASATALDANVLKYPIIRSGSTSAPGTCSSSCDCPNMNDVCESGSCVDRTTGCIDGTFARGDNYCQFKCNGGFWTCPVSSQVCPTGSAASALYAYVLGEADYGLFSIPNKGIYLQDSAYGSAITELVIVFNMTGKKGYFGSDITTNRRPVYTKKIPFVSQRYKTGGDAGKLQSCGAVLADAGLTAQQKMCNSLGIAAHWDTSTTPHSCKLFRKECTGNQVPKKMNFLGDWDCQDFATQVNLIELFDTTPVYCIGKSNLQIVSVSTGTGYKLKVVCP